MLRHYLVTALRHARRHAGYTFLNVAGLAVGLASAILILGYVRFEQSFDRFHAHADRLYRVEKFEPADAYLGSNRFALTPAPLAATVREAVPEVEEATTFYGEEYLVARPEAPEAGFMAEGLWADAHFFRVFSFPLVQGDSATALAEPNTVVLTAPLARRLFGDADPVGKAVRFGNDDLYTVTGVAVAPPAASQLQFGFVRAIQSSRFFQENQDNWRNSSWYTYVRLRPGTAPTGLGTRLTALYRARQDDATADRLYLKPLPSIHLGGYVNFELGVPGDPRMVALFAGIAAVILLLAGANYTNLAVARATRRAREVGLRKVVGARRGQLVAQHLTEALLTAVFALGIGLVLARLALPSFAAWLGRDPSLGVLDGPFLLGLAGLAVLVGVLAGAYPAFVLTAPQPARVLKGHGLPPGGHARLRALLVVGQYAAAIVLVTGSLVVYRQMQFVRAQTPGFDRAHVVTLPTQDLMQKGRTADFTAAVAQLPGVAGVAASGHLPFDIKSSTTLDVWEGHPAVEGEGVPIYMTNVDAQFFSVYGMTMAAGRAFSPAFPADTSTALILNETAVQRLGWTPAEAIGKTVEFWGDSRAIVGVVKDFHLHSLHQPIEPLLLLYNARWAQRIAVRVQGEHLAETLDALEAAWKRYSAYPFTYTFLDEEFATLYQADERLGEGVGYFTVLAFFIACLGLFGLAAHAAEQRTKEVGIRKVLGASVAGLVALLSKEFVRFVAVALVVAVPVAYWGLHRWLEGFAYRVPLGPGVFVLAGVLALVVALLTVGTQALRAATSDPVKALRSE